MTLPGIIERIAAVFGLLCVWLTTRQNIWCWPTGLVQVTLYIFVFYEKQLYSDMLLHVIYVVLQVYGWYHWLHGGRNQEPLPVTRLTSRAAAVWLVVAAVGTAALGAIMVQFNAALPYWDASIAVLSLIAQYLLARKVLENWLIWIVVDVIAIGVYSARELYPTAGLYGVFLLLCILGLYNWKRSSAGYSLGGVKSAR